MMMMMAEEATRGFPASVTGRRRSSVLRTSRPSEHAGFPKFDFNVSLVDTGQKGLRWLVEQTGHKKTYLSNLIMFRV